MGFLRKAVVAFGVCVTLLYSGPALAFGRTVNAGDIQENDYLAGEDCLIHFRMEWREETAQVVLIYNGDFWRNLPDSHFTLGSIFQGVGVTAAELEEACNLSNVQNIEYDGADGSFAFDHFLGIRFEAVSNKDGNTYSYQVGLGGSTQTYIVNLRDPVAPNAPPVAAITGADPVARPGDIIILDHTASYDTDGPQPLSVSWDINIFPEVEPYLPPGETLWRFEAPDIGTARSSSGFVTLNVSDGRYSDSERFRFTVYSSNTLPTADAGPDLTVTSLDAVTLDGSASAANDRFQTLTYAWQQVSGPPVVLTDATTATPDFQAPPIAPQSTEMLVFELMVDDDLDSATDTVTVTVNGPPNTPPTADAGGDARVLSGEVVTVDASGSSDPDQGQVLTYSWAQTAGPAVTLSTPNAVSADFQAPSLTPGAPPVTVSFEVTVSDGIDNSTDTVSYLVALPNDPPVADAGPDQTVNSFQTVTLDGSASSDSDAFQPLSYSWVQISGTAANLTNATTVTPGLTAPRIAPFSVEVLTFELTVNDGLDSATDTVSVTVNGPPDTLPSADAGPDQTVAAGSLVTLDGSGSVDPDVGQIMTYQWTQLSGPAVTLSGATTPSPGFTAPTLAIGAADQRLVFELQFSDGPNIATDTVEILVRAPVNTPPTANAGPDFPAFGQTVVLVSGLASSANDPGQVLTWEWTQVSGPVVNFVSNVSQLGFVSRPVAPGAPPVTMTFALRVNDGFVWSAPDEVTITVLATQNTAPVADAGPDQTVESAAAVTLDGSNSADPDVASGPLTFNWVQTAGPTVTLSDSAVAAPSFTAPVVPSGATEVLEFELRVLDSYSVATDRVTITVNGPPNGAPVANAGPDQTVASGTTPALDGSGSSDSDNDPLSFAWTQTAGPAVALSDANASNPTFPTPVLAPGDANVLLEFELVVNDGKQASAPDRVQITVTAPGFGERPAALVSGVPGSYGPGGTFTVTIAFSEPVSGFDAGDLIVSNASVVGVTGGPMSYVVTLSPTAYPADITIAVPENVAIDIEGSGNSASMVAVIAAAAAPAADQIADALLQRGRALINSQPKLRQFLLPGGANSFVASVTPDRSTLDLTLGKEGPLWMALTGEWSKTGEDAQDYVHLTFGAHLLRGENLILGAMLQLDDTRTTSPTESFRGEGWLVGPYLVARAANQPLVFSASFLTGETRNSLTRDGLGTDRFDTRRTLVTAGLEGKIVTKSGLILIPSFDLAHVRDRQKAYIDAAANPVPEQTVSLTEAAFGLGFEKGLRTENGDVVLSGKLSAILAEEKGGTTPRDSFRGRIDLGADIALSDQSSLKLGGYFDGIGAKDYRAWGASLLFLMEF